MKVEVQDSKKIRLELIIQSLDFISKQPPMSDLEFSSHPSHFKQIISLIKSTYKKTGFTMDLYNEVNQFYIENSDVISLYTSALNLNQGGSPSLNQIEQIVSQYKIRCNY